MNELQGYIPRMSVRDVKAFLRFADECRAACETRGEPMWHIPTELVKPAYRAE